MVNSLRAAALAAALALCIALPLSGPRVARAEGEGAATIEEEYRVTIDSVGDGRVVDTIRYSRDDFREIRKVEKKKRGFLTRRFKSDDNTGEVIDFKTTLDDSRRSVVITYDKPGYVYNEKGSFAIYGVNREPDKENDHRFSYREKSTMNSEFTLFTDQVISAKYVFELPPEATSARYEAAEKAIRYEMPPAAARAGFFSRNKLLLSVLFGLLTALFAGGAVMAGTRKAPAPAGAVTAPAPEPSPAVAPPGLAAAGGAVQASTGAVPAERKTSPGYCGKCGRPLKAGKQFCAGCGART